jgi:hypothetical protein
MIVSRGGATIVSRTTVRCGGVLTYMQPDVVSAITAKAARKILILMFPVRFLAVDSNYHPPRITNFLEQLIDVTLGWLRTAPQGLSTIATARVQPAEARRIFTGKQHTVNPSGGRVSRL